MIASVDNTVHVFLEITYLKEENLAQYEQRKLKPPYLYCVLAED